MILLVVTGTLLHVRRKDLPANVTGALITHPRTRHADDDGHRGSENLLLRGRNSHEPAAHPLPVVGIRDLPGGLVGPAAPKVNGCVPWWKQLALPAALILGCVGGSKLPVVLASADWVPDGRTLTTALAVGYVMVEAVRIACLLPIVHDSVALPLSLALVVFRWGCLSTAVAAARHRRWGGRWILATEFVVTPHNSTNALPPALQCGDRVLVPQESLSGRNVRAAVFDCLLRLPLRHGVDSSGAGVLAGTDVFPRSCSPFGYCAGDLVGT